jgi:hypothetical protein
VSENLRKEEDPEDLDLVSASIVYKILSKNGYSNYKHIVKPGWTKAMKKARKAWCKTHKHMTLEDWMGVIFTDETAIQLGSVRSKKRVRRKGDKLTTLIVSRESRRVSKSSCFGHVFHSMRRVHAIYRFLKQLLKRKLVWKI